MKKIMCYIAIFIGVLTFTACGNKDNEVINTIPPVDEVINNGVSSENDTNSNEADEGVVATKPDDNKVVIADQSVSNNEVGNKVVEELPQSKLPLVSEKEEILSVGKVLLSQFESEVKNASSIKELAESLSENEVVPFRSMVVDVNEGFLSGFDNTEIKGFKSAVQFGPMIGAVPFVGYVFELNSASEVEAFVKTLRDNANLRWNVCVEADEVITGSYDNKVFFVMAPIDFSEE